MKSILPPAQPIDATETACNVTIGDIQEKSLAVETWSVTAEQETEEATTEVDVKSSTSQESVTGHSELVPVEALSTESEAEESCDDLDPDWDPDRSTIL